MKIAVLLGSGPEIDDFFSLPEELRREVVCFCTNEADGSAAKGHVQLLDLLEVPQAIGVLKRADVTKIVTIGSIKVQGIVRAALSPSARRMLARVGFAKLFNREVAEIFFEELKADFEFPSVRSVLPSLFAEAPVAAGPPADDVLQWALLQPVDREKDYELYLGEKKIKMLRVPAELSHLTNRRLYLDKLRSSHEGGVTHLFFDIDRTVVIGLKEMVRYASENHVTLQSFYESTAPSCSAR
jgi:hypothetical protein